MFAVNAFELESVSAFDALSDFYSTDTTPTKRGSSREDAIELLCILRIDIFYININWRIYY